MIIRLTDLILAIVLAGGVGFFGGYGRGMDDGAVKVRAAHDSKAVTELHNIINAADALVVSANSASADLRAQTARRALFDTKTSRELKDALSKSAGSRANCRYDVISLRLIEDARTRANAATATGVFDTVPAAP